MIYEQKLLYSGFSKISFLIYNCIYHIKNPMMFINPTPENFIKLKKYQNL